MENSKYLPIGLKLGGHYEIVNILGEDDFEILYKVKDLHRLNTPYVIKELFLNAYSLRNDDNQLYTPAKSKYVFEETKKEVIEEIQLLLKENSQPNHIIGYFEENNTIYTIMEFIDNHNLNIYLNYFKKSSEKTVETPKKEIEKEKKKVPEEKIEESVEEIIDKKVENLPSIKVLEKKLEKRNKSKSSFFQKLLMGTIILFSLLGAYAYYMITSQKHKVEEEQSNNVKVIVKNQPTTAHYPPLIDRNKTHIELRLQESNSTDETEKSNREQDKQTKSGDSFDDFNETLDKLVYSNNETEKIDEEKIIKSEPSKELLDTPFNRRSVKTFLDKFITASINGSINQILSYYDNRVERYFSLKDVNKKTIYYDKVKYHKKWTNREFTIIDFDIIRVYKKGGANYCDIRTKTQWRVSNSDFSKTASGVSKGVMSIKEINNLFKVTSIYTTK